MKRIYNIVRAAHTHMKCISNIVGAAHTHMMCTYKFGVFCWWVCGGGGRGRLRVGVRNSSLADSLCLTARSLNGSCSTLYKN